MKIIVVDDERDFSHQTHFFGAMHIRDTVRATILLTQYRERREVIDELYLDHDLGEAGDIRALVMLMVEEAYHGRPFLVDHVYVHSQNPPGAEWVVRTLEKYYNVRRIPLPGAVIL